MILVPCRSLFTFPLFSTRRFPFAVLVRLGVHRIIDNQRRLGVPAGRGRSRLLELSGRRHRHHAFDQAKRLRGSVGGRPRPVTTHPQKFRTSKSHTHKAPPRPIPISQDRPSGACFSGPFFPFLAFEPLPFPLAFAPEGRGDFLTGDAVKALLASEIRAFKTLRGAGRGVILDVQVCRATMGATCLRVGG